MEEKITISLEELEKKYKELGEEIERLKKEQKCESRWKPKEGETYWYINSYGNMNNDFNVNNYSDIWRLATNNVFKTEKATEEYRDYILARAEYTHEYTREEWEDIHTEKWYICYSWDWKILKVASCYKYKKYKEVGLLTFKTKEKAQEFIDKYKKQILKFEFRIEEE